MIKENRIKKLLKEGKPVIGTFIKANDPAVVEVVAYAGFDFVIIDNEHTAMNIENMVNQIRAAELAGIVPTVRIKQKNAADILQALDAGAMGVQVPQVDTAEDALNVVKWAKYAPEGVRGYAASQRSAGYGFMDPVEYAKKSNENVIVVCYCETLECLNNLDEIVKIDGIDVIFIGPFDLSQALGVIGQTKHPRVMEAIDTIIEKSRRAGKAVGIITSNAEDTRYWIGKGIQYFALSSDLGMIGSTGKSFIKELDSVR